MLASRRGFPNSLIGLSTGWWTHASYFSARWPTCHAKGFPQSTKSCGDINDEKWVKSILYRRQAQSRRGESFCSSRWQQRLNNCQATMGLVNPGTDCISRLCLRVLMQVYFSVTESMPAELWLNYFYKLCKSSSCLKLHVRHVVNNEHTTVKFHTELWSVLQYPQEWFRLGKWVGKLISSQNLWWKKIRIEKITPG